ncbi:MAG: tyrosine-type recombinase/integrase [Dehalococcoidia bacterium]|nr:tyrosine-type recombinase/integrase [Dehalococcoidia bacterium]
MVREVEDLVHEPLSGRRKTDLRFLVGYYRLCAQGEGKSPSTIAIIECAVRYLTDFLGVHGMSTDVNEIGTDELRSYCLHLQTRQRFAAHPFTKPQQGHLSGHTINGYLRALRAFWSWAAAEGFINENPFALLKIPKAPKKIIPTLSAEQLARLIEAIDLSNPQGYRDYAAILLLADTGLRLSELTNLKLEDVNLERRILKVWGKGAKERMVPFGARVQRALLRYVNFYRPEPARPRTEELFLTYFGEPMKKRRVEVIIKSYGIKAGIKGVRCSPHTLRHTMAVMWVRNGGDVFSLQQILGHSTLDMVRIYVNLAQTDIEAAHRKFSPADNLELKEPRTRRSR